MLEPNDRRHVLEILRPPEGYSLDCAIGTTYSLDLLALMTVPLAFLSFDWDHSDGRPTADPLAILESLRRNSERLHIFCQSGRIAVPTVSPLLMTYLEQIVVPVRAPHPMGVFHPKVWALRFAPAAAEDPVRYRFLCLSRNLTFDRCWDTSLVLDGVLVDRQRGFAYANPLGDFLEILPSLAVQAPSARTRADVECLQREIRRVDFEVPEPFEEFTFHPLGIEGHKGWPFPERRDRALVVSPFLSAEILAKLSDTGLNHALVSRAESLDEVGRAAMDNYASTYTLSSAAEPEEPEAEAQQPFDGLTPLSGLHAKLFVFDQGWKSALFTGSANATNAAFYHNVEFLVELAGKRSQFGVDALMKHESGQTRFIDLLEAYRPAKGPGPLDPVRQKLEQRLRATQDSLAAVGIRTLVATAGGTYHLILEASKLPQIAAGVDVRCWPITVGSRSEPLSTTPKNLAMFGPLAPESLTSFIAFELTAREGRMTLTARFVQATTLVGAPPDRYQRLLRALLRDREQVLRFLLLLLSDPNNPAAWMGAVTPVEGEGGALVNHGSRHDSPLLEAMLTALSRDPSRLDALADVLKDLRGGEADESFLPEGIDTIWTPIWEARQSLKAGPEATA